MTSTSGNVTGSTSSATSELPGPSTSSATLELPGPSSNTATLELPSPSSSTNLKVTFEALLLKKISSQPSLNTQNQRKRRKVDVEATVITADKINIKQNPLISNKIHPSIH
uniref:Uncharacterized protein n=1 Tax=Cacopsylla melanoneura TaxID=428564 RepID=A0A8D9F9G3_9HEMI